MRLVLKIIPRILQVIVYVLVVLVIGPPAFLIWFIQGGFKAIAKSFASACLLILTLVVGTPLLIVWSIQRAIALPSEAYALWKEIEAGPPDSSIEHFHQFREKLGLRLLDLLVALSITTTIISLILNLAGPQPSFAQWGEGWLQNFSTGMVGAIVTYILLEKVLRSLDKDLEDYERTQQTKGQNLIQALTRLSQTDAPRAKQAIIDEMRDLNLLRGAKLSGMDLRGLSFQGAYLDETDFQDSNLTRANFRNAGLYTTKFDGANLLAANFDGAVVHDVDFMNASVLKNATTSDGTRYDGRFVLRGDLELARSSGIDVEDPRAMCEFYSITFEEYRAGLIWAAEHLTPLQNKNQKNR